MRQSLVTSCYQWERYVEVVSKLVLVVSCKVTTSKFWLFCQGGANIARHFSCTLIGTLGFWATGAQPAQIMKDFKELFWRVLVVTPDEPRRKGFIFPFLCSWISAHLSAFLSGPSHFLTVWHVRMFLKTQGPANRCENMFWVLLWKEIIVNLLTPLKKRSVPGV